MDRRPWASPWGLTFLKTWVFPFSSLSNPREKAKQMAQKVTPSFSQCTLSYHKSALLNREEDRTQA
jgi:hypothetical protein